MYSRRKFVISGIAGMVSVSIAGCLEEPGEDDVEATMNLLDENFETFEDIDDRDGPPDAGQIETIENRLSQAESHLETAAEVAEDDDIITAITLGEATVSFQRALIEILSGFAEFEPGIETFDAYMDAERFDEAIDQAQDLQLLLEEINAAVDDAKSAINDIDEVQLDPEDLMEVTITRSQIEQISDEISALQKLVAGLDDLAFGLQALLSGFELLEAEDLDSAYSEFVDAEQKFEDLEIRYSELEEDPDLPSHMQSDVIEISCISGAMHEAAVLAIEGVEAAQEEDWETFDQRFDQVGEAMDRC